MKRLIVPVFLLAGSAEAAETILSFSYTKADYDAPFAIDAESDALSVSAMHITDRNFVFYGSGSFGTVDIIGFQFDADALEIGAGYAFRNDIDVSKGTGARVGAGLAVMRQRLSGNGLDQTDDATSALLLAEFAIAPKWKGGGSIRYAKSDDFDFTTLNANLSYEISPGVDLGVAYIHQNEESSLGDVEANGISLSIGYRF